MNDHTPKPAGWSCAQGHVWADLQPMLDRLFMPFERLLVDAVAKEGARRVLDIGCGAGATSLAIARHMDGQGHCTGLDIAEPLVDVARRRAQLAGQTNVGFLCADAQRHAFASENHDAVVSRFGVMFFEDPVAAFSNIRRALRPGGALICIAWAHPADNPFMVVQERAATAVLGPQAAADPLAPGQFAFADRQRVQDLLTEAGWHAIEIEPITVSCAMPVEDLSIYARRMGRIGALMPDLDAELRARLEAALDAGFAPFIADGMARFDAACWMIRARNPQTI